MGPRRYRPFQACRSDLEREFPVERPSGDLTAGDVRLAAEVAIAELTATAVPSFAHERAFETLKRMASE